MQVTTGSARRAAVADGTAQTTMPRIGLTGGGLRPGPSRDGNEGAQRRMRVGRGAVSWREPQEDIPHSPAAPTVTGRRLGPRAEEGCCGLSQVGIDRGSMPAG